MKRETERNRGFSCREILLFFGEKMKFSRNLNCDIIDKKGNCGRITKMKMEDPDETIEKSERDPPAALESIDLCTKGFMQMSF